MATKQDDVGVARTGLTFRRYFTKEGVHPFDEVEWEIRDAVIPNFKEGGNAFEQRGVEFPKAWSQNATNIVAQKYFRGPLGTPQRESSVRQLISRVVDTIRGWGEKDGYFATPADARVFAEELTHLLLHQKAAFNSPVWFNLGVPNTPQQASACFILSVEDTMTSILNWYVEEGIIFKGGSGAGVNLSKIRSSQEPLAGGGTASGPVSFMRGADASAGTIKSGGKTRRAAKMVILNVDHPDIRDFIWCKAIEERKARVLRDAGFDMDLDGRDSYSIQYQNANNSVRVTDEFMQAYLEDRDWKLKAVLTGEPIETVRARDLMREIAQAAWECADPGMQYDTTINEWHTCPASGRINASNPCCFVGETLVETSAGPVRFDLLEKMAAAGEALPAVRSLDLGSGRPVWRRIAKVWVAGHADRLVRVSVEGGLSLLCTPEHRFLTADRGYVEAQDLRIGAALEGLDEGGSPQHLRVLSVRDVRLEQPVPVFDLEVEGTHNFAVSSEGTGVSGAVVVHNSEYMHLDNSACNLASLNLMKFLDEEGNFDVPAFKHAVAVVFTAQEIIVGNSDYPTDAIARNAKAYRQLGLGYANLGALLMARGLPYDSDAGRAWAGAITALMTGWAYRTSARIAEVMGPFAGFPPNRDAMLRVMRKHRAAADGIDAELVPEGLLSAAKQAWDEAVALGEEHGYRNAQATVLAPTGTISFLLDCDTTGIEPDLALVKTKKLVGGGTMQIVNQTVPRALERLGYTPSQVEDIVAYVMERNSVVGAPHLREEHYPVFDTSMGDRAIHYMGHVRMMAAVQPFISGAISKTVNMPERVTVEEVEQLFVEGWRLGLKAIAIYRDNCKVAQPLQAEKKAPAAATQAGEREPVRRRLPRSRPSRTISFSVGEAEGYITAGEYPDDGIGEIFLKVSKQGSTLSGVMDAFAIAVSLGLQYGVPLEAFVAKFVNMKFEPSGMTNDPDVRFASSLVDYVFRRLALDYLPKEKREALGIRSVEERREGIANGGANGGGAAGPEAAGDPAPPVQLPVVERTPATPGLQALDAPLCYACGSKMQPAGSCYVCPACGSTSGCS